MLKNSSFLKFAAICLTLLSFFLTLSYCFYDKSEDASAHLFSSLKNELKQVSSFVAKSFQKIKQDPSFENLDKSYLNPSLKIPLRSYLTPNHIDRISLIDDECLILADSSENHGPIRDCADLKKTNSFFLIKDEQTILLYHITNHRPSTETQKNTYILTETSIDSTWLKRSFSEELNLKPHLLKNKDFIDFDFFTKQLTDYFISNAAPFRSITFDINNHKDFFIIALIVCITLLLFVITFDYLNEVKKISLSESFSKDFFSFDKENQIFHGDITLKEKDWKEMLSKIHHMKQDSINYKESSTKEIQHLKEKYQALSLLYHEMTHQKSSSQLSEKLKLKLAHFEQQMEHLSSNKHLLSSETIRSASELKHLLSSWQEGITSMGAFRFIRTLSQDFSKDDFQKSTKLEVELSQISSLNQNLIDTSLRYALLVEDFFDKVDQIKDLVE